MKVLLLFAPQDDHSDAPVLVVDGIDMADANEPGDYYTQFCKLAEGEGINAEETPLLYAIPVASLINLRVFDYRGCEVNKRNVVLAQRMERAE